MAVIGSLQLSSILGFCENQNRSKQFKIVTGRGNQYYLATELSSCVSRQDLWSHRLSTSVNRPLCGLPYRCTLLRCNSFLNFDHIVTTPAVKVASAALTRSYNAFQGSPLVTKLVPPIGIVLFALWGLQPLMQLSRKIFLHKSESSWKKSTANYVMTSYLQPILLWTSAILVCRALDPIVMPTESSQLVKQRLLSFVKSLSTVLAFAFCLSSGIQQTQKYFMETSSAADSSNMGFQFAGKAVYSAVWVAAVSLFMELLGFSTQKWLTAGGLGTVLLTLAGREIFTNFLSSIMIHATRPFVVNEWIQTKIEGYEVSGTVEHVGWWSPTIIRGEDREAVHIPNHKFTVNVVRNLTQKTHWRVKTHLAISHLDASKISNIVADMRKVLAKNPQVEQQKLHRRVFLENVDPENQALMILISCFVKTSHHEEYYCVKEGILMDLLRVIKHHRARLATPIRTIQKFYNEPDLGNMSFSDSLFTRGGPASKSTVLLIETPYKINGEDKSKSQARAARTSDVLDSQVIEQSITDITSDSKDGESSTPDVNTKETSKPGNKTGTEVVEPSNLKSSEENKTSVASKLDLKIDDKANDVNADSKAGGSSTSDVHKKEKSKRSKKTEVEVAEPSSSKVSDVKKSSVASKLHQNPDDKANAAKSTTIPKPILGENAENTLKNSENTLSKVNTETQGDDEKTGISEEGSQSKIPTSEPSKSTSRTLEDNIVLGVALEGSKRTLPIEDDLASSPTPQEAKEVAKRSKGSLNTSDENENEN